MKVLLLSPYPEKLINSIINSKVEYITYNSSFNVSFLKENKIDFIISYGFSEIIKPDVISFMGESIINLHIGYLPYNKGAHPNLWSFLENTPSGITIHIIDNGIDTGKILLRKKISFDIKKHTFNTSYNILRKEIEKLFYENWEYIRSNKIKAFYPQEKGSFHLKKDGLALINKLERKWDTNIFEAVNIILKN